MRCSKCGFISFDHYTACSRCKADLSELHRTLQGTSIKVDLPLFLAPALQEALHEGYGVEEEAPEISVSPAATAEPVGLDAVAAELESQAMIDGAMASAAEQLELEEEVPSIDLGQFDETSGQAETAAEPPALDLGLALGTETAVSEAPSLTGTAVAGASVAAAVAGAAAALAPEISAPAIEEPAGGETPAAEAAPELELSLAAGEPAAEESEFTLEEAAAAPSENEDLSLGLEEINLADLVPGATPTEESAGAGTEGVDFDTGFLDLQAGADSEEAKREIFDLASIIDEPGEATSQEGSSPIVDLADFFGEPAAPEAAAAESAPRKAPAPEKEEGIPFKLEMEASPAEVPVESGEASSRGDQELPDLDLKLENEK